MRNLRFKDLLHLPLLHSEIESGQFRCQWLESWTSRRCSKCPLVAREHVRVTESNSAIITVRKRKQSGERATLAVETELGIVQWMQVEIRVNSNVEAVLFWIAICSPGH